MEFLKRFRTVSFLSILLCLFIAGTLQANTSSLGKGAKNIVLITIDGLRPEFYLSEKYETPTLKQLKSNGAHALRATPVFPTLTYPNHTSILTGLRPAKHGIVSNSVFGWDSGPTPAWYWESDKIKSPTLFDYFRNSGLTTASVRWPVTLGAQQQVDFLVPEIFGMKGYYEGDGFDLTVQFTEPKLMNEILAKTTLKRYANEAEMDFWVAEATAEILKTHKSNFLSVHLANVDHIEHGYGPYAPEVAAAVKDADKNIRIILEAIDLKNTCVVITGDHGFVEVSQKISPNLLFAEKGWLTIEKEKISSWQVVAHASGAQAAIYVKDKKLLPQVEALLREKAVLGFNLIDKKTMNELGAYPEADFAIEGREGFAVSGGVTGTVVAPSGPVKGQHGVLPSNPLIKTGLIMTGCGFKKGHQWKDVELVDIAPTIAKIARLGSAHFDGQVLK